MGARHGLRKRGERMTQKNVKEGTVTVTGADDDPATIIILTAPHIGAPHSTYTGDYIVISDQDIRVIKLRRTGGYPVPGTVASMTVIERHSIAWWKV